MSWKLILKICIPAFALLLTFKIYIWLDQMLAKSPEQNSVQSSGEAAIGGKFILVNQDGKMVADSDFRGKLMLVYFGFTSCPDTCPVDLALITNVMNQLQDEAKNVQPVFISVDPMNDVPQVLKKFLSNFYPGIVGLTGTQGQIAEIVGKYHIFAKKVETAQSTEHEHHSEGEGNSEGGHEGHGGYTMDHSSYIYLMGKDGKYITHFNDKQDSAEIVAKIKASL